MQRGKNRSVFSKPFYGEINNVTINLNNYMFANRQLLAYVSVFHAILSVTITKISPLTKILPVSYCNAMFGVA